MKKSRIIKKEGPTNCVITTTRLSLHPENETRLITLNTNDSADQTGQVLITMAKSKNKQTLDQSKDINKWQAHQCWLETQPAKVRIPYAEELAKLIPPVAVRLRRDFSQLLTLIEAYAFICQLYRERDEDGYIIATLEDYAIVRDLVADLFPQNINLAIRPIILSTVHAVERLLEESNQQPILVRDIAKFLGIDNSSASRRVKSAIESGFLKNLESKERQSARIILDNLLPEKVDILPQPEKLRDSMNRKGDLNGSNRQHKTY